MPEYTAVICYVDIEHEDVLNDPEERDAHLAWAMDVQLRLEELAAVPCLVQHYRRVTLARLKDWGVQALIISGNASDWESYPAGAFDALFEIIREADIPILGICGGHQLICMAHGAPAGPIRPLAPGAKNAAGLGGEGYFKEWGFLPVDVLQPDPLFEGLGEHPVFLEMHYWEVKQLPAEFILLASTAECGIQAVRHRRKPLYGVQFHPEAFILPGQRYRSPLVRIVYPGGYDEAQPDGQVLLRNFLRIAGAALSP